MIMDKAYYRKQIIDLRARITKEKEAKKKDNEQYARLIKGSSTITTKAQFRKIKVDRSAYHDRTINNLKAQVERLKEAMKRA